jgi:AhpD family alkylhydroperoxidase
LARGIQLSRGAAMTWPEMDRVIEQHFDMEVFMRHAAASVGISLILTLASLPTAYAQNAAKNPPPWMQQTYPEKAIKSALAEMQAIEGPGALDEKTKQLIGLGVSAQIPCQYCVYYHTKMAKAQGATDEQIKEAIATAALTRKWSTVLNGADYDMPSFRKQVDAMAAATH